MLDNSFKLNNAYVPDGSSLAPYVVPDPIVPNTDNDAFYASILAQSEDPVGVYEQIKMEQEANDGMSDIIINVRDYYRRQKDSEKALLIEEIIADDTIDRESKKQLLESFTLGEDKFTLQDEYLNFLTNSRLAEQPDITPDDLEYVDFKMSKLKIDQSLYNFGTDLVSNAVKVDLPKIDKKFNTDFNTLTSIMEQYEKVGKITIREGANALQVIKLTIPLLAELAVTGAHQGVAAISEKTEIDWLKQAFPDVKWGEARQKVAKFLKTEEYAEWLNNLYVRNLLGYEEGDINKGAVAKLLQYLDAGLTKIGETTTPDDPMKGRTLAEILLFFIGSYYRLGKRVIQKGEGMLYKELSKQYKEFQQAVREGQVKDPSKQLARDLNTIENPLQLSYNPVANKYNPFKAKEGSPFVETVETNPKFATELVKVLSEDVSGAVWDAMKITPEQFLAAYYGPRIFDVEKNKVNLYDAMDAVNLKIMQEKLNFYRQQQNIDSVFIDTPERLQFTNYTIQDIGGILSDPNIRMMASDLRVQTDGVKLYTSTSFRKPNSEFYTNPREVLIHAKIIENTLARQAEGRELKISDDLTIESYDLEGNIDSNKSRSIKDFEEVIAQDPNLVGRYAIRWEKIGDFTEVIRDRSTGFGNTGYLNWKGPVAKPLKPLFTSSRDAYNLFFNYGALSKELQATRDIAGLKGLNILTKELQELAEMSIKLGSSYNRDLRILLDRAADYYYKNQRPSVTGYRGLDKHDIVNILGYTPKPKVLNDLFYAKNLIEDMLYFRWQNDNVKEINRYIKAGYNNHVMIPDPVTGLPYNYMVKSPLESLRLDPESFTQILDLATKEPSDFSPNMYLFDNGKHYIIDTDGVPYKEILRLGTQYVRDEIVPIPDFIEATGETKTKEVALRAKYNYVAVDIKTKLGGIPKVLVPYRPHYMPQIVEGTQFVRRYPKYFKVDGVVRDLSKEVDDVIIKEASNFRDTVGAFNDIRSAELFKESEVFNDTMRNNTDYVYNVEKADELSWNDLSEYIKLQEATMRTASRRGDHLKTAIYKDPLESLIETTALAGSKAFYQLVLEQQKIGWVKKWGDDPLIIVEPNKETLSRSQKAALRVEGIDMEGAVYDQFPMTMEQINPATGSRKSKIAAIQAQREWQALTQLTNGFPDDAGAQIMVNIANFLEEAGYQTGIPFASTAIERAGTALQKRPGLIGDTARNFVTTILVIYSAFWKHWIQQPIMGVGYLNTGANFNPARISKRLYNAMATIGYAGLDSSLINRATKVVGFDTAKYRDGYRQKAYEAMTQNWGKDPVFEGSTGWKRSFEVTAYLYESLYNRGVFNLAEHTLAKGLVNNKTQTLGYDTTTGSVITKPFKVTANAFGKGLRNMTDFFSKASVQTGEHIHRALAAEAAIEVWEAENPGKSWYKNEKAMDQIAQYTRQMTQSMDRMASNTYQRHGLLKVWAHLQTFAGRLSEQFMIPEASPFTRRQNMLLTAYSVAAVGSAGWYIWWGLPAKFIAYLVAQFAGEDTADMLDKGILYDIALLGMMDHLNPTYKTDPKTGNYILDEDGNKILLRTTTRPSQYLNPMGGHDNAGLFYADMIRAFAAMMGAGDIDDVNNKALQAIRKLYANVDLYLTSLALDKPTDDQIAAGIEALSQFTGLTKQISKYFLYDTVTKTMSLKTGQETDAVTTKNDAILTFLLNSQPEEVTKNYKVLRRWRDNDQLLKDLADDVFDGLTLGLGTKKLSPEDIQKAIGAYAWHLKNTHNVRDEKMDVFWSQITLRNNQRERSLGDNVMQNLVDYLQMNKDNLMKDEQAAVELILRMIQENPNAHPDYEFILETMKNRTKGDIGFTEKIHNIKNKLDDKIKEAKEKYKIEVKPGD